jgi:hypothetical protein
LSTLHFGVATPLNVYLSYYSIFWIPVFYGQGTTLFILGRGASLVISGQSASLSETVCFYNHPSLFEPNWYIFTCLYMLSIIQVSLPPPPLPNLYLPISITITILFRYFPPYLLICLIFLHFFPNSLYSIINIIK